jgi:hypothetical protein
MGVLSTVTPNNEPHGAVVYYALDDDFTMWLLTKKGTHKYDNMVHNATVMLTVFEPQTQTTVQVRGTAAEYANTAAVNQVSNRIFGRMMQAGDKQLPPIMKLQAGPFTAFAITPASVRMAVYSRPDPGDYEQLFESMESFELKQ